MYMHKYSACQPGFKLSITFDIIGFLNSCKIQQFKQISDEIFKFLTVQLVHDVVVFFSSLIWKDL